MPKMTGEERQSEGSVSSHICFDGSNLPFLIGHITRVPGFGDMLRKSPVKLTA